MIAASLILLCSALLSTSLLECVIPFNFFQPYDVLVIPYFPCAARTQFFVGYEGAFKTKGYMADISECIPGPCPTDVKPGDVDGNVLQIWQKKQDGLAALKGFNPDSPEALIAQEFLLDHDGQDILFTPCANLKAPLNLLMGARFHILPSLSFNMYIPYLVEELTHVSWRCNSGSSDVNTSACSAFLNEISELSGISMRGWKRHGPGDLMVRAEWNKIFPQAKPWLRVVNIVLRTGVSFPTGLKADPNKLLAESFGYGGGPGINAEGELSLGYEYGLVFGIDVSLLHLFGTTQCQRIKTDPCQTDLFFPITAKVFREPGLRQKYTLYAEKLQERGGLSGRIAYQYLKRNEDFLYLYSNVYDPIVANNAESLQEHTAHSFIFSLSYDGYHHTDWRVIPSFSAFLKIGFNGKRTVLADTVGFIASVAF